MSYKINHKNTLRAWIELIVRKGLNILKDLRPLKFTDLSPPKINGNSEDITIVKSKTFHPSLK